MLIAPSIKAMADKYPIPVANPKLYQIQNMPEHLAEIDIKLAENQSVVYVHLQDRHHVTVVDRFELKELSLQRGTAHWVFESSTGQQTEGSFNATTLIRRLSAKLVMPMVILQSRNGLRTTFRFRVGPEYRLLTAPRFKDLTTGG